MISKANKNDIKRELTAQGKRLALLIKELDLTERKFAFELEYKHPSIIYAAEKEEGYPISPELMGRIKKYVKKKLEKDINPEWLLTGNEPKFLTILNNEPGMKILEEDKIDYKIKCEECLKKDAEYKELNEKYRKLLEDYNDCLKQLAGIKKASSE